MEVLEIAELFDDNDLKIIKNFEQIYITLDVKIGEEGITKNFFTNKYVTFDNFPNTLKEIGKKYNCYKNIIKYIYDVNSTFIYRIKLDKTSLFEMSVSIKEIQ